MERVQKLDYRRGLRKWTDLRSFVQSQENQNCIAVALLALFLGFWLPYRYDFGLRGVISCAKGYGDTSRPAWLIDASRNDPKIGQAVAIPQLHDLQGKPINMNNKDGLTVLGFVGDCAPCVANHDKQSWSALADTYASISPHTQFYLVVTGADVPIARSLFGNDMGRVKLAVDYHGDAAFALNAIYNYRRYVVDKNGKLLYLSSYEEADARFANALDAALSHR